MILKLKALIHSDGHVVRFGEFRAKRREGGYGQGYGRFRHYSSSFFSSVGCADDEALTRHFQTSFLFVFWSLYQSW